MARLALIFGCLALLLLPSGMLPAASEAPSPRGEDLYVVVGEPPPGFDLVGPLWPTPPEPIGSTVADLAGRPDGAWPRPRPLLTAPAVQGGLLIALGLATNYGQSDFHGRLVVAVPEIGFLRALEVPVFTASNALPAGNGLPYVRGIVGPNLIFQVVTRLPVDAPSAVTVRVWFEGAEGPVGESIEHRVPVAAAWCAGGQEMVFTAGQKRVRLPWDPGFYAFTVCNADSVPRSATIVAVDKDTLRPLLNPADAYYLAIGAMGTVAGLFSQHTLSTFSPIRVTVPGPGAAAWQYTLEPQALPADATPLFVVVWDSGIVQVLDGDSVTFAEISPSKLPALPASVG